MSNLFYCTMKEGYRDGMRNPNRPPLNPLFRKEGTKGRYRQKHPCSSFTRKEYGKIKNSFFGKYSAPSPVSPCEGGKSEGLFLLWLCCTMIFLKKQTFKRGFCLKRPCNLKGKSIFSNSPLAPPTRGAERLLIGSCYRKSPYYLPLPVLSETEGMGEGKGGDELLRFLYVYIPSLPLL